MTKKKQNLIEMDRNLSEFKTSMLITNNNIGFSLFMLSLRYVRRTPTHEVSQFGVIFKATKQKQQLFIKSL